MKTSRVATERTNRRSLKVAMIAAMSSMTLMTAWGVVPSWWSARGVLSAQDGDDFQAVNAGQVKHIAKMAAAEMNDKLPQGAGTEVDLLVASFDAVQPGASDFDAVNVGQLKAVAKPFYDRLISAGIASTYPWAEIEINTERNDFELANAGQVKHLFSFELGSSDSDEDGLPDAWELQHHGSLDYSSLDDADGDGLSEMVEFLLGLDPASADSDNDGVPDGNSTAPNDLDRDGLMNSQEASQGRNPQWKDHPLVELEATAISTF